MSREVPGAVILEDGSIYKGQGFGGRGVALGELVFNTAMSGYQEVLTDPSYRGQMIVFTFPMIGNYGINRAALESAGAQASGVVVKEARNDTTHAAAEMGLHDWLLDQGVVGVSGVDTRALTRKLRSAGAMRAACVNGPYEVEEVLAKVRAHPSLSQQDTVGEVGTRTAYTYGPSEAPYHVVALDTGVKHSILDQLVVHGCRITVLPPTAKASVVLALQPNGIFLCNGPGDPAVLEAQVGEVARLIGDRPLFGICLGHQILSQALGLKTSKLKFGHRGANHPVKNLRTGHTEITSQNHGFVVDLPLQNTPPAPGGNTTFFSSRYQNEIPFDTAYGPAFVTHINLYDGTAEGLRLESLPVFSVQYHPEASPGPHDSRYLFGDFVTAMEKARSAAAISPPTP